LALAPVGSICQTLENKIELNIMVELLVILGAQVTLLLSVAIMNIYRWRTDVLIGPYISKDSQPAVADTGGDTAREETR